MMKLLQLIMKKPTDKTIRITNISFGLIYILLVASCFFYSTGTIENTLIFGLINLNNDLIKYIEIALIIPGIIPVLM
mgnify:FL=1